MPTGYTDSIKDGISFEQFAWNCARAFGALIMMRDEPAGAPIPEFEPSDYSAGELKKAQARLADLKAMTPQQAELRCLAEYDAQCKQVAEWNKSKAELRRKYETMLEKVRAWNPPTPDHAGLKEFMEEQIVSSIKFDCSEFPAPELVRGKFWLEHRIQKAQDDIAYHAKSYAEEVERTNGRNKWVRDLNASIPMPAGLRA